MDISHWHDSFASNKFNKFSLTGLPQAVFFNYILTKNSKTVKRKLLVVKVRTNHYYWKSYCFPDKQDLDANLKKYSFSDELHPTKLIFCPKIPPWWKLKLFFVVREQHAFDNWERTNILALSDFSDFQISEQWLKLSNSQIKFSCINVCFQMKSFLMNLTLQIRRNSSSIMEINQN